MIHNSKEVKQIGTLIILYHSQEFGNTAAMAEAVAEGAKAMGAEVKLININEMRFDIEQFRKFDAVAFGSPDYWGYIAGGLKVFVDDFYIARKSDKQGLTDKPYGLFYSHGGGGNVRIPFEDLFNLMRIGSKVGKTIESYGMPNSSVQKACHELGRQLVETTEK